MESKYYTPKIEEFYVGFECELKNSSDPINFGWEQFKIIGVDDAKISGSLMDWSFYDSVIAIKEEAVRVKYLDQEDIESLGFEKTSYRLTDCYKIEDLLKQNEFLLFHFNEPFISIDQIEYDINGHMFGAMQVFRGGIKNKSELKQVLKMLRIL